MVEQLEAKAARQLAADMSAGARVCVTVNHDGALVEVRARRTSKGAVSFGFSYGGVRFERSALLLLVCPEHACERSQAVKRQWLERNPQPPTPSRRMSSAMKSVSAFEAKHLQEDAPIECAGRVYAARPASFVCMTPCPVNAHRPQVLRKSGWDIFEKGKYVAGGLQPGTLFNGPRPLFPNIDAARVWLAQRQHEGAQSPTV